MSEKKADNVRKAREYFRIMWAEGDERLGELGAFVAEDCVAHILGRTIPFRDMPLVREMHKLFADGFPDLCVTVEDVFADDENAAVRWKFKATHTGPFLELGPTNESVEYEGIAWMRFKEGRIVEAWDAWNFGGMLDQLRHAPQNGAD